jgi:flagellar hook-associated protein 1
VALQLAQLGQQGQTALSGQTFSETYSGLVAGLGNALSSANDQVTSNTAVSTMLLKQRDSVSGVSLDEEMANLVTFQKAYIASAHIITTVDEMLQAVLDMKR